MLIRPSAEYYLVLVDRSMGRIPLWETMLPRGQGWILIWPRFGVMGAGLPDQLTNVASGKIDIRVGGEYVIQYHPTNQPAAPFYVEIEPTQEGTCRDVLVYDELGLGHIKTVWVVDRLYQVDSREPDNSEARRRREEARQEERRLSRYDRD